jgi:hypothetical protein
VDQDTSAGTTCVYAGQSVTIPMNIVEIADVIHVSDVEVDVSALMTLRSIVHNIMNIHLYI